MPSRPYSIYNYRRLLALLSAVTGTVVYAQTVELPTFTVQGHAIPPQIIVSIPVSSGGNIYQGGSVVGGQAPNSTSPTVSGNNSTAGDNAGCVGDADNPTIKITDNGNDGTSTRKYTINLPNGVSGIYVQQIVARQVYVSNGMVRVDEYRYYEAAGVTADGTAVVTGHGGGIPPDPRQLTDFNRFTPNPPDGATVISNVLSVTGAFIPNDNPQGYLNNGWANWDPDGSGTISSTMGRFLDNVYSGNFYVKLGDSPEIANMLAEGKQTITRTVLYDSNGGTSAAKPKQNGGNCP